MRAARLGGGRRPCRGAPPRGAPRQTRSALPPRRPPRLSRQLCRARRGRHRRRGRTPAVPPRPVRPLLAVRGRHRLSARPPRGDVAEADAAPDRAGPGGGAGMDPRPGSRHHHPGLWRAHRRRTRALRGRGARPGPMVERDEQPDARPSRSLPPHVVDTPRRLQRGAEPPVRALRHRREPPALRPARPLLVGRR